IGAARSALLVAKHPDFPEHRVLARVKGNLCAEPEALAYSIAAENGRAMLEWHGSVELKAEDLLNKAKAREDDQQNIRQVKKSGSKLLAALDVIDPDRKGVSKKKAREEARISSRDLTCAITGLTKDGIIEEVPVEVMIGSGAKRQVEGIRRRPKQCTE